MKQMLSLAACTLLLTACSKNNNDSPPKDEPVPLKYLIWAGEKNGNTKVDGVTITYNAQNRLASFIQDNGEDGMRTSYDNDGNAIMNEVWTEDVLSRIHIHYVNGRPDTAVERFYLKATNVKTDVHFMSYTIENNRVVRIRQRDSAGIKPTVDYFIRYTGDNVTSMLQTPAAQIADTVLFAEWTYGTKSNPFSAGKTKFFVSPTGNSLYFQSANEPLTQRYRIPGLDVDLREKFVYQYDKQGYPVRQAGIEAGETDSTIVQYEYRP